MTKILKKKSVQTIVEVVIRNPKKQSIRSQHADVNPVEKHTSPFVDEVVEAAAEEEIKVTSGSDLRFIYETPLCSMPFG